MRIPLSILIVLLALTLTAGSARAQGPADEPPPPPAQSIEELEGRLTAIMDEHSVPGAAVVLVTGDEVLWEGALGVADVESGRPVTPETLFRIGSISKSFVGLAALQLEERGQLDLNAPLAEVAPEVAFENRWEATDPVRVVHLIEHTSGFANLRPRHYLLNDGGLTLEEGLAETASLRRSQWRPGTYNQYSNVGPGVAAYVIQKIVGEPYEAYVAESIFEPLGMASATFFVTDAILPRLATSYAADGRSALPHTNIILRPSGAITVEPREMAPFLQMLLNEGRYGESTIVAPDSIERMRRPATMLGARNGLEVGYALGSTPYETDGFTYFGHSGGVDGFTSDYGVLPEGDRGYFLVLNSANGAAIYEMIEEIHRFLTRDLSPPPAPESAALSEAELDALVGSYAPTVPIMGEPLQPLEAAFAFFDVTHDGENLTLNSPLTGVSTLYPLGPRQFRGEEGRGASIAFTEDAEGRMILQDGLGLNARRIAPWELWLRLGTALLFVVGLVTTLLFALIWIPRLLLRRLNAPHLSVRLFPLLALLAFLGMYVTVFVAALGGDAAATFGRPTAPALVIFLLSLAFGLFSAAGFVQALRELRWPIVRGVKLHSLLVSSVNLIVAVAMVGWGLIGYMSWR